MPRDFAHFRIALACATALAVCGCTNSAEILQDQNDGGWFSKPVRIDALLQAVRAERKPTTVTA